MSDARSAPGAAAFARIRGYLATLRQQSHARLTSLQGAFTGQPFYPATVCPTTQHHVKVIAPSRLGPQLVVMEPEGDWGLRRTH